MQMLYVSMLGIGVGSSNASFLYSVSFAFHFVYSHCDVSAIMIPLVLAARPSTFLLLFLRWVQLEAAELRSCLWVY